MPRHTRKLLVLGLIFVLIISVIVFLWSINNRKRTVTTTAKQNTVTTTKQNGIRITTSAGSDKRDDNSGTGSSTVPTNTNPSTPSGTFVSNHRPNLDGQPAPNQMNSVCKTTPGVTCEIRFTKDGQTKTLGPSRVGGDGYVSWDWALQDIDLTEGVWQIEAIAMNVDKTSRTKDPVALEVRL